jgi:small neutral amino acid transporter SnatA (MarC family)
LNSLLAILAFVAALNPARTRLGIPDVGSGRAKMGLLGVGIAIGVSFLVLLGVTAGSLLDALEISPETFRIAAGFVMVIVAAWMIFVPVPTTEPVPDGVLAWVWPVAYPRLVSPESIMLALSVGASDGIGLVWPGLTTASAMLFGLGLVKVGPLTGRLMASVGRIFAVVLVLVGVWLALQGVRQV